MIEEQIVYETISQEELKYGTNNTKFLEISRKKAPDNNEFIAIAKGYYNQKGEKKYKTTVGFPIDKKLIDFIINGIQKAQEKEEQPAAEEAPQELEEEPEQELQ